MKVACVSDTHGHLPDTPACDLLIVAGDFIGHGHGTDENWLIDVFGPWLLAQPATEILGICGNHEFVGERTSGDELLRGLPWTYLRHEAAVVAGMKTFGSPYTPTFFNWAFMLPEAKLADAWAMIPDDTELLVTHGPPYGIMDATWQGKCVGSTTLRARIRELPDLKLHVFGHIHDGVGTFKWGPTTYVNAAYVDDRYQPGKGLIVVEL